MPIPIVCTFLDSTVRAQQVTVNRTLLKEQLMLGF